MELTKNFEPADIDARWYQHWLDKEYFNSRPDEREAYTIVIPPPNVTGMLHMGHCLNNTIQDILARRARMQGKNTCWVPGTDHASIATESKVVAMLRERGITKSSLSREAFLEYAWEWKEKYGGIILQQLKKLGCSLDWSRVNFTMDPEYSASVNKVFIELYRKGHIYRGKRMINWDPQAKTALSDEEVMYREVNTKLYHLRYPLEGEPGSSITIATVRPETILGDSAICVNPTDERYQSLIGKYALVPLINRRIPIIADDYVTVDFGTGALKVTPAHDMNDYQLGQKHQLEVIDILNEDGSLNETAQLYIGKDRFEARQLIITDLEAAGHLVKVEEYTHQAGFSERSNAVVEPRLSLQWWVSMKKLSEPALAAVMDGEIKFYPAKFKNLYRHWMENIKDWCISRQLWWGHRIPAWYDDNGRFVVAENQEAALELYRKEFGEEAGQLRQDEDCMDTWFSSWLWPFEVFKGLSQPGNPDIQYYYPTNALVTAPEIIFFWVARMIVAGYEFMGQKPFSEVYFTGIVRDKQGRKMSKQFGNSPDLLGLIDKYGADAARFGILISSPAGNDLLFDEGELEQGRNFNNKIWNALKLVKMWEGRQQEDANGQPHFAVEWFEERLFQARGELDELFREFRLSEALKTIYSLIWDDFCSWYLEWVKPGFEQPIPASVYRKTVDFFTELCKLLHPFMPFVTEEVYHHLQTRTEGDDICVATHGPARPADTAILQQGNLLKEIVTALRDARIKNNLKPRESVRLHIETAETAGYNAISDILAKQVNAESIAFTQTAITPSIAVVVQKDKFYMESDVVMDTASQREEMLKDLEYLKGFLVSVEKKLGNEKFVQNAKPEVVETERRKKADAEEKIGLIEESLRKL